MTDEYTPPPVVPREPINAQLEESQARQLLALHLRMSEVAEAQKTINAIILKDNTWIIAALKKVTALQITVITVSVIYCVTLVMLVSMFQRTPIPFVPNWMGTVVQPAPAPVPVQVVNPDTAPVPTKSTKP